MISSLEAAILGAIQGLTEFLPISSSGHLVLAQHFFHMSESPLFYDVLLHLATLLATVVILREQVVQLLRATLRLPRFTRLWFQKGHLAIGDDPEAWTVILILISTAVTGTIGVLFHKQLEEEFSSIRSLDWQFAITGGFLLYAQRKAAGPQEGKPNKWKMNSKTAVRATPKDAFLIGLAQGIAIIPAISRSGATIAAALLLGFDRKFAGEYSFLIALPAIAGAVVLESRKGLGALGVPPTGAIIGFILSFILGVATLKLLLGWIRGGKLNGFAYYCLAIALFCFVLRFM